MEETWNEKSTNILKSILTRRNIKYHELAIKLNALGIEEKSPQQGEDLTRIARQFTETPNKQYKISRQNPSS